MQIINVHIYVNKKKKKHVYINVMHARNVNQLRIQELLEQANILYCIFIFGYLFIHTTIT